MRHAAILERGHDAYYALFKNLRGVVFEPHKPIAIGRAIFSLAEKSSDSLSFGHLTPLRYLMAARTPDQKHQTSTFTYRFVNQSSTKIKG